MIRLALALAFVVAGCGARDTRPLESSAPGSAAPAPVAMPGLRLPTTIVPSAYAIRLDVDPDRETFRGRVEIRARVVEPTDRVWLHAVDLEIGAATFRSGAITGELVAAARRDELQSFGFGRTLPPGELELVLEYSGHVDDDAEGIFRQRKHGAWFSFTQAQSVFARRIVPCFDEPALKASWQLTLVVPTGQIALANAPIARETMLPDARREVQFAPIGPLSSYLLAFAVGPFALVDGGTVGRDRIPFRVATTRADSKRAAGALTWTPKLVAALEHYLDAPLPLAKLDFVAVPAFFGAMENSGLVLFEDDILLGDPRDPVHLRKLVRFIAHELAHQWFGNSVTPVWWNELWISEAFATFFDDKLSNILGALDDAPLRAQQSRAQALHADRAVTARPIRHPIASSADIEDAFDAISYEKGAAILAMIEAHVGETQLRDMLRAHVRTHAGRAIAAADVIASLPAALAPALASYLDRKGAPVVNLALECAGKPRLAITPRDGAVVPVCVRYPDAQSQAVRECLVANARTELPLASCPAWLVGNAHGRGYYHVAIPPRASSAPELAAMTSSERIARGQDVAAAIARGELAASRALDELDALLALPPPSSAAPTSRRASASREPYALVGALAIATELARTADAATHERFVTWLAKRLGDRLGKRALFDTATAPVDRAVRDAILDLVPASRLEPAALDHARGLVDRAVGGTGVWSETAFSLAAGQGQRATFDKLVAAAARAAARGDEGRTEFLLAALGESPAALAPDVAALALDRRFDAEDVLPAIERMFERVATRSAIWQATRDRLAQIIGALSAVDAKPLLEAVAAMCDAVERAEIEKAFANHAPAIPDGPALLARSLSAIDRCVATKQRVGDLAAAIAARP